MLHAEEVLDPTVSTLSKPPQESLGISVAGRAFSSLATSAPVLRRGRLAKGLRIGMIGWSDEGRGSGSVFQKEGCGGGVL